MTLNKNFIQAAQGLPDLLMAHPVRAGAAG